VTDKFGVGHIALTGGEPFLHPQISQIFDLLVYLKEKKAIDEIGIYSNGYLASKINTFLKTKQSKLNGLILGISIDGKEKTHDLLRGKTGAYKKTIETIMTIKKNFPNVKVKIKFTISPYNYKEIFQIFDFCRKNKLELSPKFIEVEPGFYYNKKTLPHLAECSFNKLEKNKILNTFEKISKTQDTAKVKIIDPKIITALSNYLKHGNSSMRRCLTPFKNLFLNNLGGIYPCVYKEAIGNVSELERENFLKGKKHRKLIAEALNGECPKCFAYHGFLKRFNL
jgi:sulfatase maturation enzyme AslB (radical SAM superfamily)